MNNNSSKITTPFLRQLLASTLPPYIPFVKMERSKEVEDKLAGVSSSSKKNTQSLFNGGVICSLCAYQEKDNLRGLSLEETNIFQKLIEKEEEEEFCYFCESCFKMVIKMIKLSKEVETLTSRLTQSVTCVKSVLRISRRRSSPQQRSSSKK
jgi:hypothetical protein